LNHLCLYIFIFIYIFIFSYLTVSLLSLSLLIYLLPSSPQNNSAKIGDPDTSFFHFTHQPNWCNTIGHYGGKYGDKLRCPEDHPTWCICKWATARWISGEGCHESVSIDCDGTDICQTQDGLFFSYDDYQVDLKPAHECVAKKCPLQWTMCAKANAEHPNASSM
jgi:hypothetical protein